MKHSIDLLTDLRFYLRDKDGKKFNPLLEIVRLELERRRHSKIFINNVFMKGITVRNSAYKDTEKTAFRLIEQHYHEEVLFTINLREIQVLPYWIVCKLIEWGFEI